jgi:nucleoside-diphosphate-sugar epimerase
VGIDHVIYGVGLPEQFTFDKALFENINYGLFKIFLESFKRSGIKSLTYISTYEVFKDADGTICECDQLADEINLTPYFRAMLKAYKMAVAFARENDIKLTTIHPAALYGGKNTGDGFTNYIENIVNKAYWKVPFIVDGNFPVVHAESLADAIIGSLDLPQGPYIVSDQMTSLKEIAIIANQHTGSYVPVVMPLWVARIGVFTLEAFSRIIRSTPIMSNVQLKFITKGLVPSSHKLRNNSMWVPLSLNEGLKKYIDNRRAVLSF